MLFLINRNILLSDTVIKFIFYYMNYMYRFMSQHFYIFYIFHSY